MKKCRGCAKKATLHITEIHDGQAEAVHLCESCARDYLDSSKEDQELTPDQELASKLESLMTEGSGTQVPACPECGMTLNEFREKGRFGCPNDYLVFSSEIGSLLESIHDEVEHAGKRPRRAPRTRPLGHQASDESGLVGLRRELADAVEAEDYERAAELRDRIQELGAPDAGPE